MSKKKKHTGDSNPGRAGKGACRAAGHADCLAAEAATDNRGAGVRGSPAHFRTQYERVRKVLDEMRALSDYYDPAFYPNPEQEVWQERMDAELRDLIKDKARCYTFAERHPIIPCVRWKRQKGVTPIEWKGEGR